MIGPHYQKIAEVENKLNARQLLQKIQSRSQINPLTQVIDKLKRQFSEYQTAYSDSIIDYQIHSLDRLLSFDGKLGPILNGLEKQNNLLRKELNVLQNQLSNTVSICQQILAENNSLKEIIKNKNLDLQKIIDTIALNESEERGSLQDKISLLQQQNSILIRHLDEIRKEHQSYNERFLFEKQQSESWKMKFEQTKRHLSQFQQQQQQISRKLTLVEHNLYNQTQKVYNLEAQVQALKFQNNQMKNQLQVFTSGKSLNDIQSLKTKLQEQYAGILEEHRSLKKQRAQILKQSQTNKIQKQQAFLKIQQMQSAILKLQKDLSLTQNILSQQKQKNTSLQNNISKLQLRFEEVKAQNNKIRLELQSTHNYAINKENILNRQIQQLRKELDRKSIDMEKSLKDLKEKTKILIETKQAELKDLNQTNIQLRKLLERHQKGY